MKSNLVVEFFKTNNYSSIKDTGMTWDEVGSKFNISGEAARSQWRNYKPDGLLLKSRWQVQTKEGIEWLESYKAGSEHLDAQNIRDIIDSAYSWPVKAGYPYKYKETNVAQIINIADVHLGMDISNDLFGFSWNAKDYYARLDIMLSIINNDKHVIINQLGDFTDGHNGETTRGGHKLPQNMSSKETIDLGVKSFLYLLDNIESEQITINWLTNSNHPGVIDYAIGYTLSKIVAYRYSNVTFNLIEDFFFGFNVGHHCFLLHHGKDDKHMNRGFGRFLNDKECNTIRAMIHHKNLIYQTTVLRGDLHQYSDVEYPGFRDIITPSFANPSAWVQFNFGQNNCGGFTSIDVTSAELINVKLFKF